MKYFSMFSGIGGFELGIQRAFSCDREQQTDTKISPQDSSISPEIVKPNKPKVGRNNTCIGYSEIDKYAIKVYERHFNGHTNYGDATTINATELPDFDLLVGGFPCQAFSVAGKRLGFNETRGTLFFDIARILKEKQPRHLVLENVKGLLSHDSGRTFSTIIGVLSDLGYLVEWQVLNSKNFGVPQNRERVFIVGHFGGECGRQVFPISQSRSDDSGQGGVSSTLTSNYWEGVGSNRPFIQQGGDSSQPYNTIRRETPTYDSRIRRLTPKECERLQAFPDDWTAGESDTQRYKMCGNAVTVNVVEAVIRGLYGA